ncbi:MAG: rhomboid family intramembrane serine protease [Bacteroidales bacterium]|nr:rhomboid family intramembrane serine protease [Bacteroidales bacterium]
MMNQGSSFLGRIPVVTKNLLIINVLMLLASTVFASKGIDLNQWLGLHYWQGSKFNVAQLITYMFLHDGFTHLFFNMFSLFMFGELLERVFGSRRFLFYYISCGIGAAIVQELVWWLTWENTFVLVDAQGLVAMQGAEAVAYGVEHGMLDGFFNSMITIGASGAVFGILLAFGMTFPNLPLYLMFIPIPIKAKWMVLGYGAIELFFGISGFQASVAHFAHLGGMIFGFLLLLYWKKKGVIGGGIY